VALFQQLATPVRVAFLAVIGITVGVVGVSASLGDPDGGSPASTALGAPPHVIFGAVPVEHGQVITMGDLRLHNPSGADVEIVDVEATGPTTSNWSASTRTTRCRRTTAGSAQISCSHRQASRASRHSGTCSRVLTSRHGSVDRERSRCSSGSR
jgi:hypothetical protein